jgi:serine/threonine-protein kinase
MGDVFVSYKAEDRKRVQPLVQALQADGYSVWWDEHIGTGDEWRQTIECQLDGAKCVVVIWSKGSAGPEGHFVRDEASRAQRRHVYVPVLIDAVEPPLGFGESQATSLRRWKGDCSDARYQAVLAAVRRIAGAGSQAEVENDHSPHFSRRAVVSGGVAAAAFAGFGGWALLKPGAAEASESIAVLPFANLSGDPSQAYFSDGIAEELRSVLGRVPGLKVIGRTSSEMVRAVDAVAAAKRLAVNNVVTGSVRRSPSLVRVSAQLVSGRDGVEQWSEVYDRAPGDVLQMQSEIAKSIAAALRLELGQGAVRDLIAGGSTVPEARDLYLQGIAVRNSGLTEETLRRASSLFDRAIAADPNFADAYAQKANVIGTLTGTFSRDAAEFKRGYTEAAMTARKAIALAPKRSLGHAALAGVLAGQLDIPGAVAEYERAHQLLAADSDVPLGYSLFMAKIGRSAEALEAANQALSIDPLNPGPYAIRSNNYWFARRYAEAAASYRETISRTQVNSPVAYVGLGNSLMLMGRTEEAKTAYSNAPPHNVYRLTGEAILAARTGDSAGARAKLEELQSEYGDSAIYQQAQILAQMQRGDDALAAIERALEVRDPGLISMPTDPFVDPIRGNPRFAAVKEKLRFPA